MDAQTVQLVGMILGPLLGAGAGTYFGLKGALNGLKESARRADTNLEIIKDVNRQALFELIEHRKETSRYVGEIKQDIKEK